MSHNNLLLSPIWREGLGELLADRPELSEVGTASGVLQSIKENV